MTELSFSRRHFLTVVVAGGVASACGVPGPMTPTGPVLSVPARIRVRAAGRIVSVPVEEYVLGSALAEVTPIDESPATVARIYEVQAVLARTYAASHLARHRAEGFDLCDSTHCQLYEPARVQTSRFAAVARAAVLRTSGQLLAYAQRPVEALFHADCGGHTDGADAVWGGAPVPYLLPAPDNVPAAAHRSWKIAVSADDLRAAFNADARSRVGRKLDSVTVRQRDVSGRAAQIALGGEVARVLRGEELRAILNQKLGDKGIQSTRFSITKTGLTYTFQGTGFGHGVGLCQLGAATRARRGESLDSILGHYFQGAKLLKTR